MNNSGTQKKFSGKPNCFCANTLYPAQAIQWVIIGTSCSGPPTARGPRPWPIWPMRKSVTECRPTLGTKSAENLFWYLMATKFIFVKQFFLHGIELQQMSSTLQRLHNFKSKVIFYFTNEMYKYIFQNYTFCFLQTQRLKILSANSCKKTV